MNWFTIALIVLAVSGAVIIVVHEILTWRKPGTQISQNAPMDSAAVNNARLQHHISNSGPRDGAGGFGTFGGN